MFDEELSLVFKILGVTVTLYLFFFKRVPLEVHSEQFLSHVSGVPFRIIPKGELGGRGVKTRLAVS